MNLDCWYCISETNAEDDVDCAKGQNIQWCDINCPIYKHLVVK